MDALTSYAAEFPFGSVWSHDLTTSTTHRRPGKLIRRATPCRSSPVHSAQVKLIWSFDLRAKTFTN